ncbi:MAG TPA: carbonic anhydrase [Polyangiales bacterium]
MKPSDLLLLNNKSWAKERVTADPEFFTRLTGQQRPRVLWIGCSDSRVPANTITGTDPGEIFVHRNIANVCVPNDVNMLSVLQYAVDVLEVAHVIVCGHYGCGGVIASMGPPLTPPINDWLENIRKVHKKHVEELDAIIDTDQRASRLVEWNAREHAHTIARTPIIQNAWKKRNGPWVHAWVYGLQDGVLKELEAIEPHAVTVP